MELFSEIYGKYYKLIASLLTKLPLTRQEINGYVTKEGFAESNLYLLPKLLDKMAGHYLPWIRINIRVK